MLCAVVLCGWPVMSDVVRLLFGHGKLDAAELAHIANLARIALLSLPCIGLTGLAASVLNAQRKPQQVLRRTLLALLALPLLCLPGLYYGQAEWLMWGLPGLYLLCSVCLFLRSGSFLQKGYLQLLRSVFALVLWLGVMTLAGYVLADWLRVEDLNLSSYWQILLRFLFVGFWFFILLMGGMCLLRKWGGRGLSDEKSV